MATVTPPITFEEFEQLQQTGRAIEYWHGKVVEKAVPTWLHSLLQVVIGQFLTEAGYAAGSEPDLRISREFAPRPDIMATSEDIETQYPTHPGEAEIIVEILSPTDNWPDVEKKCREYMGLGVVQVFVADPEGRQAWVWRREAQCLGEVDTWILTNGEPIVLADVWRELDRRRYPKRR
jgi:Uma2 family endonuclease